MSVPSPKLSHPPTFLSSGLDLREFFDEHKQVTTSFGLGILGKPDTSLSHHMDEAPVDLRLGPNFTTGL